MKPEHCGCCEGVQRRTPQALANRPGLSSLAYRIGTHSSFLETMKARLSDSYVDVWIKEDGEEARYLQAMMSRHPEVAVELLQEQETKKKYRIYRLHALTTRDPSDPSIALLDAWATVADVLTFYQERIGNEGYLLTATERRSIVQLANLVGYTLKPGVASSAFLAFTLDKGYKTSIPAGTRGQSMPNPSGSPQSFETSEPLQAREEWSRIQPRRTMPQFITDKTHTLYLKGVATGLKPNDPLLVIDRSGEQFFRRVLSIEPDPESDRSKVVLTLFAEAEIPSAEPKKVSLTEALTDLMGPLSKSPSLPPRSARTLKRAPKQVYGPSVDTNLKLLSALKKAPDVYAAIEGVTAQTGPARVYAFRTTAALFGNNVPKQITYALRTNQPLPPENWQEWPIADDERSNVAYLDGAHDKIQPGSYIAIRTVDSDAQVFGSVTVHTLPRSQYGISAKTTRITLPEGETWREDPPDPLEDRRDFFTEQIRGTVVYAESEPLELAEEPIVEDIGGATIELDGLYEGLEAGRWLIVSGERSDIAASRSTANGDEDNSELKASGVNASERVMVSGVSHQLRKAKADQKQILPGESFHTVLTLANELAYTYKRDSVVIHGNVVKATQGETRREILGNGDGARARQTFTLAQLPLTHLAAPTPEGAQSTLKVRINDVRWHESDNLFTLDANARGYITRTDDEGKTNIIFGDGIHGARLPSGSENISAMYRSGIGKSGNVGAKRISLLATKPLGVKAVINPLPATGGADAEGRDQARENIPLALMALDRIVSVQDYADFARSYAGIAKASAACLPAADRQVVHVTVAGVDDIPIDRDSELYLNLYQALRRYGDPHQPIRLATRELMLLVIFAGVRVLPDYQWDKVEPRVRQALLDAFAFEKRALGQEVLLSEVIGVIQAVSGVAYVDVDILHAVSEDVTPEHLEKLADTLKSQQPAKRIPVGTAHIATDDHRVIKPARLAYLDRELQNDTLVLWELTHE